MSSRRSTPTWVPILVPQPSDASEGALGRMICQRPEQERALRARAIEASEFTASHTPGRLRYSSSQRHMEKAQIHKEHATEKAKQSDKELDKAGKNADKVTK